MCKFSSCLTCKTANSGQDFVCEGEQVVSSHWLSQEVLRVWQILERYSSYIFSVLCLQKHMWSACKIHVILVYDFKHSWNFCRSILIKHTDIKFMKIDSVTLHFIHVDMMKLLCAFCHVFWISCLCYFQVDIVVGTPGRMEDLISAGHLSLTQCRFFVLDEADGLLKQGYTDLIDRLHRQIPKITSDGRRLQMIVCSATLHAFEVKKMAVSFRISRPQLFQDSMSFVH